MDLNNDEEMARVGRIETIKKRRHAVLLDLRSLVAKYLDLVTQTDVTDIRKVISEKMDKVDELNILLKTYED